MDKDPDLKLIQERIEKLSKIFRAQMDADELDDALETNHVINRLVNWKHQIAMQKYSNAHFIFGASLTELAKHCTELGNALNNIKKLKPKKNGAL